MRKPKPTAIGPTQNSVTRATRTDTQKLLVETNRLLHDLLTSVEDQTDVTKKIESNTVPKPLSSTPNLLDRIFGDPTDIASHS